MKPGRTGGRPHARHCPRERTTRRGRISYEAGVVRRYLDALENAPAPRRTPVSRPETLEAEFVLVARNFATRRRIGYDAWREVGVSAAVLRRAGIERGAASTHRPR